MSSCDFHEKCLDSPMTSGSRFTCAVQTEEAAHGAHGGTTALMLIMLMMGLGIPYEGH